MRKVEPLDNVLHLWLRRNGLETPLQQRRLLAAWEISSPALRTELGMMRKALLAKLNQKAGGTQIVTDIRFY